MFFDFYVAAHCNFRFTICDSYIEQVGHLCYVALFLKQDDKKAWPTLQLKITKKS